MILTLARDNSGQCVGLRLPAEPADIAAAYEKLYAISMDDTKTHIRRADTGVNSLDRWLRDRKMDRPGDYIELGKLSEKIDMIAEKTDDLEKAMLSLEKTGDTIEEAEMIRDTLLFRMSELRVPCDEAELLTAKRFWPFPTYADLLFGK